MRYSSFSPKLVPQEMEEPLLHVEGRQPEDLLGQVALLGEEHGDEVVAEPLLHEQAVELLLRQEVDLRTARAPGADGVASRSKRTVSPKISVGRRSLITTSLPSGEVLKSWIVPCASRNIEWPSSPSRKSVSRRARTLGMQIATIAFLLAADAARKKLATGPAGARDVHADRGTPAALDPRQGPAAAALLPSDAMSIRKIITIDEGEVQRLRPVHPQLPRGRAAGHRRQGAPRERPVLRRAGRLHRVLPRGGDHRGRAGGRAVRRAQGDGEHRPTGREHHPGAPRAPARARRGCACSPRPSATWRRTASRSPSRSRARGPGRAQGPSAAARRPPAHGRARPVACRGRRRSREASRAHELARAAAPALAHGAELQGQGRAAQRGLRRLRHGRIPPVASRGQGRSRSPAPSWTTGPTSTGRRSPRSSTTRRSPPSPWRSWRCRAAAGLLKIVQDARAKAHRKVPGEELVTIAIKDGSVLSEEAV